MTLTSQQLKEAAKNVPALRGIRNTAIPIYIAMLTAGLIGYQYKYPDISTECSDFNNINRKACREAWCGRETLIKESDE